MGWNIGYDNRWKRDIGYGVPAYCDHPYCDEEIDRGIAYVCGGDLYGGVGGCGLFFCSKHIVDGECCERCAKEKDPFRPKPDHPKWMNWKLSDESWEVWRQENPEAVKAMRAAIAMSAAKEPGK